MRVDHSKPVRRSVYDGQDRLGDFQLHGTEVVARDRYGKILGIYATMAEAIDAIAKATPNTEQ